MKFSRIEVALKMKQTGIVPVFYHQDVEVSINVLKACYEGGVRVFEFTNRGDNAHEIFRHLIEYRNQFLPELALGIGSLVDAPTTALYIQMGADFIVSPVVNEDMAKLCNRRKVAWCPGCGSVSEISFAEELGAEVVKVFPATQVGGPSFIKAVKAPQPWTNIMPTGGVKTTFENLQEWFNAGAYCVGIGAQLFIKDADGNFDLKSIKEKVIELRGYVDDLTNELNAV
ncbi:bifunctional 4-hydroxy-2-oxoglutarate aldolase/2-dehydro-3-deoxy-phosphogluconate aldolase [Flammeovirga agarivorans]|nr:bifunctional 4-hydroxy-2-oxoglutarate aldolase/2-dehydro-3-deoxy-phosphogluconate aldolase [Flammeovirga agarivorans]